jgi:hypothetical protein
VSFLLLHSLQKRKQLALISGLDTVSKAGARNKQEHEFW